MFKDLNITNWSASTLNLSINPTYLCNLRCDFCYLTSTQLSDVKKLDIDRLDEMLAAVDVINHVDLYGGEISTLPEKYQVHLLNTIRKYYSGDININTNLIKVSPLLSELGVITSVSFDGPARERWEVTLSNMAMLTQPFAVLVLCSPKVLEFGAQSLYDILSGFSNLMSVEIKPYSSNQSNDLGVSYVEFEEYVKEWIYLSNGAQFNFQNIDRLTETTSGRYSAYSDDHVYITPEGKYAVLEFDLNDNEYFLQLDSMDEVANWAKNERVKVSTSSYCSGCEYLGKCLTEHYRHVDNVHNSCNGFYSLIKWWEQYSA